MIPRLKNMVKRAAFAALSSDMLLALKHFRDSGASLPGLFGTPLVVSADVPSARVLVLAPHPDDEVIGAGGVMALHRAHGNPVLVVYMTDDQRAENNAQAVRVGEARALGQAYGLEQVFLGGEDSRLEPTAELVAKVAAILHDFSPTHIFVPSYLDAHADHFAAGQILAKALRAAPTCAATVFGYEVWTCLPHPNCVFNVTSVHGEKIRMLSQYPSQTRIVDFVRFCTARGRMRHTMHVNSLADGFAEAFLCCPAATYLELYEALPHCGEGA